MKNLAQLTFLILALCFTGCKKESQSSPLIGKWETVYIGAKIYENNTLIHQLDGDITRNDIDAYITFEFLEEGAYITESAGTISRGTYRTSGDRLYFKEAGAPGYFQYTFTINGNTLGLFKKDTITEQFREYRYEDTRRLIRM